MLLLAALLCACAGKPAAPDSGTGGAGTPAFYVDGTRLRNRILTASDGTQLPLDGLWDTKLGTVCAFTRQADGGYVCISLDPNFDAGGPPDYVTATISP